MTRKPIVARLPNGAEYGFPDEKTALKAYPEAKVVRYQDGSALEKPEPKKATAKKDEKK